MEKIPEDSGDQIKSQSGGVGFKQKEEHFILSDWKEGEAEA